MMKETYGLWNITPKNMTLKNGRFQCITVRPCKCKTRSTWSTTFAPRVEKYSMHLILSYWLLSPSVVEAKNKFIKLIKINLNFIKKENKMKPKIEKTTLTECL